MEFVLLFILMGVIGGIVASNKGRSVVLWVLLSLFIPLAFIILLFLPNLKKEQERQELLAAVKAGQQPDENKHVTETDTSSSSIEELDTKDCPQCAEAIKSAAKICRFCGHEFERPVVAASEPDAHTLADEEKINPDADDESNEKAKPVLTATKL